MLDEKLSEEPPTSKRLMTTSVLWGVSSQTMSLPQSERMICKDVASTGETGSEKISTTVFSIGSCDSHMSQG